MGSSTLKAWIFTSDLTDRCWWTLWARLTLALAYGWERRAIRTSPYFSLSSAMEGKFHFLWLQEYRDCSLPTLPRVHFTSKRGGGNGAMIASLFFPPSLFAYTSLQSMSEYTGMAPAAHFHKMQHAHCCFLASIPTWVHRRPVWLQSTMTVALI